MTKAQTSRRQWHFIITLDGLAAIQLDSLSFDTLNLAQKTSDISPVAHCRPHEKNDVNVTTFSLFCGYQAIIEG